MKIRSAWLKSFILLILFTILCGGLYPLLVTVVAQILFPSEANGSLISKDGTVVGSLLLAQKYDMAGLFSRAPFGLRLFHIAFRCQQFCTHERCTPRFDRSEEDHGF